MLKKKLCVCGILAAGIAIIGVSVTAGTMLHGTYHATDNGYYLVRDDAVKTHRVAFPAETQVREADVAKVPDAALQTVELTYQYSAPGKDTKWDIYTDQNQNQYTYQETTGRLVSVLYLDRIDDTEKKASYNDTACNKENITAFAQSYLKAVLPDFSMYSLFDYQELKTEGALETPYPYTVKYAVPIGAYFFDDPVILRFSAAGELIDASFPVNAPVELSEEDQTALLNALPSYDAFCKMAVDEMTAQYAGVSKAEVRTVPTLSKTVSGYELRASVVLTYAEGKPFEYDELQTFSYEVSAL